MGTRRSGGHRDWALPAGVLCALLAGTRPALADIPVVWVFAVAPTISFWATAAGLVFEAFCVWRFLGLDWRRSIVGVVAANVVSTLLGAILIVIVGLPIELALRNGLAGHEPRTQILVGFSIAQVLIPALNTAIEMPMLFKVGVRWEWRSAAVLYGANFVSVGILIWPLLLR